MDGDELAPDEENQFAVRYLEDADQDEDANEAADEEDAYDVEGRAAGRLLGVGG